MNASILQLAIAGVLFLVMLMIVWWWGYQEGRESKKNWEERAKLAEAELDATIVTGKKRETLLKDMLPILRMVERFSCMCGSKYDKEPKMENICTSCKAMYARMRMEKVGE